MPNQSIPTTPPLVAVVGPTASGKSDVAIELALLLESRGAPCEIVSADSMQVYRQMDIGTAKPDEADRRRVAHHMLDLLEPTEACNVSLYREQASGVIEKLLEKGKGAIVVGGTGLYVKALIDGLNRAPAADPSVRARLEEEARSLGAKALYERLVEIDPEAARKIHPNNLRRVVRALEVYEQSGKPFSAFHQQQEGAAWCEQFSWRGLRFAWKELDGRIEQRTKRMFESGLLDEVRRLLEMGCRAEHTSMQGLGYKEVAQGLAEGKTTEEMMRLVEQRTRRYARRQMTWWRPEKRISWLHVRPEESPRDIALRVLESLNEPLGDGPAEHPVQAGEKGKISLI